MRVGWTLPFLLFVSMMGLAGAAHARADVHFQQGRVQVDIAGEPLVGVLNALGRQAGFKVIVYGRGDLPTIRDRFEGYPLLKALRRLLGGTVNYSLVWDEKGRLESVVVLTAGKGARVLGQSGQGAAVDMPPDANVSPEAGSASADAIERLIEMDVEQATPEVYAKLMAALQSGDRAMQENALDAIANLGVEPPLSLSMLRSFMLQAPDPDLQAQAMDVLMLYDDPVQLRAVLGLIASEAGNANASLAREYLQQLKDEAAAGGQ